MVRIENFFAPCPAGLEAALAAELIELGASEVRPGNAGVVFRGPFLLCYAINLRSRIASRVLWRVATQHYRSEEDIYRAAYAVPWPDYFSADLTIRVDLSAIRCPLKSLDFVTLRIKDAVCDKFRAIAGKRPNVATREPGMRIHAFLTADEVTLYLDTSGEPLFKRGARLKAGEAPLRENLAAGILRLSGWKPGVPLLDPMCGSGTFLIEAAQIALGIAPGVGRRFGFERLSNFERDDWQRLREQSDAGQKDIAPLPIYGSDLYGDVLSAARTNLAAVGLDGAVHLKQANALEISAPVRAGCIVTNPPYGVRSGEQAELEKFYPQLGDVLKKKFSGWTAFIFTADLRLPKLIRLTASRRTPLFNGALECRLLEYRIVSGSNR